MGHGSGLLAGEARQKPILLPGAGSSQNRGSSLKRRADSADKKAVDESRYIGPGRFSLYPCCGGNPRSRNTGPFRTYGPETGLTNPSITALLQDRRGYLWAATEGGVFRYDGDRFRPFPARKGLQVTDARSIHGSCDGQVWVATTIGLFRLGKSAPATGIVAGRSAQEIAAAHSGESEDSFAGERLVLTDGFTGIEFETTQALSSDRERLYAATREGLRWISLTGGAPGTLWPGPVHSVLAASGGVVWFGCGDRICSLQHGEVRPWGPQSGVPPGAWLGIAEDSAGRLWVRSKERVLVRDPKAGTFRQPPGLPVLRSTNGAPLTPLAGGIVIPHTAGLMVCNGHQCRNEGEENGLQAAEVHSIMEDREGSIWIGYSGKGLHRLLGGGEWLSFGATEGLTSPEIWANCQRPGRGTLDRDQPGPVPGKATRGEMAL